MVWSKSDLHLFTPSYVETFEVPSKVPSKVPNIFLRKLCYLRSKS